MTAPPGALLAEATQRDILAGLAKLGPAGPIPVVFASDGYARLLDNWLCHMDALGLRRLLVVAMDPALAKRLGAGWFPVVRGGFDGSLADFWLQRARVWAFLADQGVEIIHSDADAVWLRNPIPEFADTAFDLLISQGTLHPVEVQAAWGFVLCNGFFWARPTLGWRRLLHMLTTPPDELLRADDQATLNRLLAALGTEWQADGAGPYAMTLRDRSFTAFRTPLIGLCRQLDLRVVLLPHHLFPRLQPGADDAMVRHVLRDAVPERRMREVGCWRLDAHPGGFVVG